MARKIIKAMIFSAFVMLANVTFAASMINEDVDWGVKPQSNLRVPNESTQTTYVDFTPTVVPGVKTIKTPELAELLKGQGNAKPLVIFVNTSSGNPKETASVIPGSKWLQHLGKATPEDELLSNNTIQIIATKLGNANVPIVLYCSNPLCWLSYNASLRIAKAGFKNVYWYRGGRDAWKGYQPVLPMEKIEANQGIKWLVSPTVGQR